MMLTKDGTKIIGRDEGCTCNYVETTTFVQAGRGERHYIRIAPSAWDCPLHGLPELKPLTEVEALRNVLEKAKAVDVQRWNPTLPAIQVSIDSLQALHEAIEQARAAMQGEKSKTYDPYGQSYPAHPGQLSREEQDELIRKMQEEEGTG